MKLKQKSAILLIQLFILPALTLNIAFAQNKAEPKPSQVFEKRHSVILSHLDKMDKKLGQLVDQEAKEQQETMKKFVLFMENHILPHAQREEEYLYRAVNKRVKSEPEEFTATMSQDHKIVKRWTEDLKVEGNKKAPDVEAFRQKGYKLIGLISAHFEKEERVLLPILDKTMTAKQFENEVMSKMAE